MNRGTFSLAAVLGFLSMTSGWSRDVAAEQRAVLYLSSHPGSPAAGLEKWMRAPHQAVSSVFQASRDVYLITAGVEPADCGTYPGSSDAFFAVSRTGLQYRVTWRASEDQPLGRRETIAALPPTAAGHPRFYLDANSWFPCTGVNSPHRLSIWEWDGARALTLLTRDYVYLWDDPDPVKFDGEFIRVHTNQKCKVLWLDMHGGVDSEWTVRVRPKDIEDLGVRRLDSDHIGLIDELYYRIEHSLDATDLATPEAIATLTISFLQGGIGRQFLDDLAERGNELCINGRVFTLSGGNFVTAVRELPRGPGACRKEISTQ